MAESDVQFLQNAGIEEYVTARRELVNSRLQEILDVKIDDGLRKFIECMRYAVLGNGKRLRPLLCLATFEMFDSEVEKALDPACGLELIHCASLMLDDLPSMDNASLRRNKPTSHAVYGEGVTILASAALFTVCFNIFSKVSYVKINALVKDTTEAIGVNGLIGGQFMDISSFNKARTVEELDNAYFLKTGVLFCNAVKAGALLGGADREELVSLERFAKSFSLAFQIRDDIMDAISEESAVGKDVRIDLKNGKPNYPSVVGLGLSREKLEECIIKAKACLDVFGEKAKILKGITDKLMVER